MVATGLQCRIISNVNLLLSDRNMRPEHLCRQAKIDPGNFSKFMHGKKASTFPTLEKIATAFNVDIERLFLRGGRG